MIGETFHWYLLISGDHLDSNSSLLNHLPQVLDTARKVNIAIEGVQGVTNYFNVQLACGQCYQVDKKNESTVSTSSR